MTTLPKAVKSAGLTQYQTPHFMERFLDAIHEEGRDVERSQSIPGTIKLVDGSEMSSDALDYFVEEKSALESEFCSELMNRIGSTKTDLFCDIISRDWFDGKGLRNRPRVLGVKLSVRNYLDAVGNTRSMTDIVVNDTICAGTDPLLSIEDVAAVLTVNDQMLTCHVEVWKARRSDWDRISSDDIFFRRGLSLKKAIDLSEPYREWDFINSYSLAFTAPEKFASMQGSNQPAIVSGDLALFGGRVLFFSPFVPKMDVRQLEAGIIPGGKPDKISFQGEHGGILEYILGEQPADDR